MDPVPRQRRSDRVVDPAYLQDLGDRSTAEVRVMRDECREEEARLSYLRRVLQGQLDLARAEIERRGDEGHADLLDALPAILADEPATRRRDPQATQLYDPEVEAGRRADDGLIHDPALGRLPDLSDDELRAFVERLSTRERDTSRSRRTVLDHLDRLQDELVRRYREGAAHIDDVVASDPDVS